MMKTIYKNPFSKIYQYEYAIYLILSSYFKSTTCESRAIETLRLYYADLVKTTASGNCSYEKQYQIEEESEALIKNAILGNIRMPHMNRRDAKVTVIRNEDGTHTFTFRSGKDSFTYRLMLEEEENSKPKREDEPKHFKVSLKVLSGEPKDSLAKA